MSWQEILTFFKKIWGTDMNCNQKYPDNFNFLIYYY